MYGALGVDELDGPENQTSHDEELKDERHEVEPDHVPYPRGDSASQQREPLGET